MNGFRQYFNIKITPYDRFKIIISLIYTPFPDFFNNNDEWTFATMNLRYYMKLNKEMDVKKFLTQNEKKLSSSTAYHVETKQQNCFKFN